MRRFLLGFLCALLWPALLAAQPYANSSLGAVTFDTSTYEQYGKAQDASGADIWLMTWASDGNIYGFWGDGEGWDLEPPNAKFGVTRITDDPPSLAATDVFGQTTPEQKAIGVVGDASSIMRGFYSLNTDARDGSYYMHSDDNGSTWTNTGTKIFSEAVDGVRVEGMAQAGQAYTGTLPAHASDSYYYVYLHNFGTNAADFYLARVPKAEVGTKASYEYVSAIDGSNNATWTSTIGNKIAIFTDSNGSEGFVSVTWWPAINRWVLVKGHNDNDLGVFEGERPWGPWKTLYYGDFRDTLLKFTYQTPQKWMASSCTPAAGDCTLWMAFSGWPEYDNVNFIKGTLLTTDTVAPKAPTDLQVTTNSTTQLTLTWTAPTQNADDTAISDLAGYRVVYCTGAACTPTTLITPDLGLVTTYAHTGRTAGTTHRYLVRAVDTSGNVSADSLIAEGPTASEQTLAMSATSSTPNNWTLGAGINKVDAVAANDGNASYITSSTSGQQQQYAVTNPTGIAAADSILNVRLRAWATKTVSQGVSLVLTGVVGANTSASTTALTQNTYTEHLHHMTTKPGGGSWTVTDLNNLEARVQPSASRSTRVTMLEAIVTYVPDPAPKPPAGLTAEAISATEVALNFSPPTENIDGSPLTDLAGIRVRFCDEVSCLPDTDITPDLGAGATTYTHTGLTTDTPYYYDVRAIDSTGKVSARSAIANATPSATLASLTHGAWRFNTPGLAEITPLSDPNTPYRLRQNGRVRIRLQLQNSGAPTTTGFPIECNIDGGSYATLTTTCGSPGVCLQANGGVTHGASVARQLDLPEGFTWATGAVATNVTWPSVAVGEDQVAEMEYDLAIEGMTTETVCCRIAGLDAYPGDPGPACFSIYRGSSSRG